MKVGLRLRHGHARRGAQTSEHNSWASMIQRCTLVTAAKYPRYGGRGIRVCERWMAFENFYADMGRKPTAGHSIDRIDNDGNYDPTNCRWATRSQQMRNKSTTTMLTVDGVTRPLSEWCEIYSIPRQRLDQRVRRGWDHKTAMTAAPGTRFHPRGTPTTWITIDGVRRSIPECCEAFGIPYQRLIQRIERGWDPVEAVLAPPGTKFLQSRKHAA